MASVNLCPHCKTAYQFPAQPSAGGAIHGGANSEIAGVFECSCHCFFVLVWPGEKPKWFIMR